ncbi:MAG: 3-deoxy-7-phosphoheptulonate synthase [Planctomycetes bacterium]|nr:3-deoxy-7-phosphoheptulonate synthase [Planctomycetota bacterium]
MELTDNIHIKCFKPLSSPRQVKEDLPQAQAVEQLVLKARNAVQKILVHQDSRCLAVIGPCSLHDEKAALEYAGKLKVLQTEVADRVLLVMRAYFEKPRTTLGWKGMLYDPHMDGSYDIEEGLRRARRVLLGITELGVPAATEFLDPIVPQYTADLVSWAAIGARTTESQIHRQMVSGLSMPIGFKNATDGTLQSAIDAIKAASSAHSFMGIDRNGQVVIAETRGNRYGHVVMRGGKDGPNYGEEYVAFTEALLRRAQIDNGLLIDCSHDNSNKDYRLQGKVCQDVIRQLQAGNSRIVGVMLESFLNEGKQAFDKPENLQYGVSVTDSCLGWDETETLVRELARVD